MSVCKFTSLNFEMIEVTCNDRLGKKVRVKCKYPLCVSRELVGWGNSMTMSLFFSVCETVLNLNHN